MFFSGFNELSNLLYYKQIQVVVQPMVEYRVCFMQVTKGRQMFFTPRHIFRTYQKTATTFNLWLYFVAKITSRCEFGLRFLILVTLWILRHVTTYGCYVWIFSSFNMMVYQVVKHSKIQPMVESRINFVRVAEYRQIFLRPDMSSYAPETAG